MKTKHGRSRKAPDKDGLIESSKPDALRAKLAALDLTEKDLANAVASLALADRIAPE